MFLEFYSKYLASYSTTNVEEEITIRILKILEQLFMELKIIKSKVWTRVTDAHFENSSMVAASKL